MNYIRTKERSGNFSSVEDKEHGEGASVFPDVVPLFGRDEMNLVEFPFGPITATTGKTLEVEHVVYDRTLKREVSRRMVITGSDAFGLPRPIDDQVLIGMKALTHDAAYASRKVEFSRYLLCRVLGWVPDGRAYQRLEESFDRIAGTTLKFKDGWWDKGEREWKSKTFHLIEEVDLCSRDRLDRARLESGKTAHKLCSFVWSEVIWKSLTDGYIKSIDMSLFRRIAGGKRREVPLRLYRILDKRFHYGDTVRFDIGSLCVGTLGLSPNYSPSQMLRILERAAEWLIECDYLERFWHLEPIVGRGMEVVFRRKRAPARRISRRSPVRGENRATDRTLLVEDDEHRLWVASQSEAELLSLETRALECGFGSDLQRKLVLESRESGKAILRSGRIRQQYVRSFQDSL